MSLLATAALGLIAFVPFVGLAVLPLQLLAWMFRGVVFQFLGLTSIGAYLRSIASSCRNGRDRRILGAGVPHAVES